MVIALVATLGWAQESSEDDVSEEVIVYGELRVERARQKVIEDLEDLGYTEMIEKDGAVVMRHESAWKGDVWLHDDGWMRIKRQPVQVEAPANPFGKKNSPGAWAGCVLYPFVCVKTGGQMVGTKKFRAVETRTSYVVNPDVAEWADRVADLSVDRKSEVLPDMLQALWDEGVPLAEGDPMLTTVDARKAAILQFWETRTDNPWGEEIRGVVESFIRGVVQHSEHPYTDAEIRQFNRRSRAGRALDLKRRVADEG